MEWLFGKLEEEKNRIKTKKPHKIIWGFYMNILKVVFVIIGTLIGAGFASGQEMYLFFFSYGLKGLFGILISSIAIGVVIYKTLIIIKKYEIRNYKNLLEILIKTKSKNVYFNIKSIINLVINIFILITFFIMIAGFGAYFEQEFGINSVLGSSILSILCFIIFITSTKGVIKVNEFIIPILITSMIIIGIINIKDINIYRLDDYLIQINNGSSLISGLLYASYNSILLIPVLITLKDFIKTRKQIAWISIISVIIIIILSIMVFLLLIRVDVDITKLEMPAVYVVSNMVKGLRVFYGMIILGSIFTTAISLGTSFLQNVTKDKKSYTQIAVIMCIISVIISKVGFSNLINLLYPIFGYLGLLQIVKIII